MTWQDLHHGRHDHRWCLLRRLGMFDFGDVQQISTDFNRLCLVLLDLLGLHWNHYRNLGMLMLLNESFPNMFADGPCNPRSNEMQHGSTSRSVTLRLRCAGRWIATGYVVGNISVILASNDVPRASTEGGYGGRVGVHMTGW